MLRPMTDHNPDWEPIVAHGGVYLRPPERTDVPLFVRWFGDARTNRTLGARAPMGLAEEEGWFERMLDRHGKTDWFFTICRREDDRPVGNCGLHGLDTLNGNAGLGIAVGDPADRGQGYGRDALRALIAFGFGRLRLERIYLDVYDFNVDAQRLYERIGFVREGVLRHEFWRDGRWVDSVRMAMLVDEWRALDPESP